MAEVPASSAARAAAAPSYGSCAPKPEEEDKVAIFQQGPCKIL
jgi:hypothetical protein